MRKRGPRKAAPGPSKRRAKVGTTSALPDDSTSPAPVPTIVGIGASAGGLEALTRLLHSLSRDTGLAYVVIQHLARDHESVLSDLLGRAAPIPVEQARDGIRIDADHAYVIPPDATMTVTDGHLRLVRRAKAQGLHLPIDTFLSSLADVHGSGAIAVILSGAGSDGARGVEAIKEMGGLTFAQDSESARHASMPEAAVATGSVDFVLPPEAIAVQLARIGRHEASSPANAAAATATTPATTPAPDSDDLLEILKLVHRRTGVDFVHYRRGTVERRILRRMLVHHKTTPGDYLALVRRDASALDFLYEDLLIGVTSFFRDADVFAELRNRAFPDLMRTRPPGAPFRIWVAGCSGGEETYSLAIALLEFLEETGTEVPVQMFGTDLSDAAVQRARAGVYPASIADQVSGERLRRFFVAENGNYRIAKHVRDLCVFSRQNIVRDPPFSHLDLISCRNVLIYFEPTLQRRVFPIFHYALEPHGLLVLGNAESPGPASDLFEPLSKRHKLYRRCDAPARSLDLDFSRQPGAEIRPADAPHRETTAGVVPSRNKSDLAADLDRLVLEHFGRQGVVVNEDFQIMYFRGDTSAFLVHGPGTASLDLLRLARPELTMPLRIVLARAATDDGFAVETHVALSDGDVLKHATIEVLPLPRPPHEKRLYFVLFSQDSADSVSEADSRPTTRGRARRELLDAAKELAAMRDEMAATKSYLAELVEQHETTVEELRAAGEEIQSSNEELQSTNEELETAKEEVQSTNEELTTLNEELHHRNRDLGELASDMANVFASTVIPIVIVGRDFRMRRFTPATHRVLRVVPSDTGRPIGDIKLNFVLPNLEQLILNTVATLAVSEHVVRDDSGAWWSLVIRPYQTVEGRVDGAVLVFTDIDSPKRAEERAEETSEERRRALNTAEEARIVALARANEALLAGFAERERAEADRNALLRKLNLAQEEERRRLSRELHDEAGQHLTLLGLGLQALSDVAPPGSEIDRRAEQLRGLAATLGGELHGIALRLRPKALDDFGLEAALSSYAEEWSRQSGIVADVHVNGEAERLPTPVESAAYRVAQEALTNVAKHSGATRAGVVIERRDGNLHVIVEDDGRGFDPRELARGPTDASGLGLLGIRERVALLGGTVDVESAEGRGTTLFVRIPVTGPYTDRVERRQAEHDHG